MRIPTEVMFFPNGNTAVLDGEGQIQELQQPWLLLFVKFLEERGIDPLEIEFRMPNASGIHAKLFRTSKGTWNWEMKP